jgi:hypothetical protein
MTGHRQVASGGFRHNRFAAGRTAPHVRLFLEVEKHLPLLMEAMDGGPRFFTDQWGRMLPIIILKMKEEVRQLVRRKDI